MSVTSRQTLLAAMRCEQPDKVPIFEVHIDEPIVVAVVELLGLDAPVPASPDANVMWGEDSVEALEQFFERDPSRRQTSKLPAHGQGGAAVWQLCANCLMTWLVVHHGTIGIGAGMASSSTIDSAHPMQRSGESIGLARWSSTAGMRLPRSSPSVTDILLQCASSLAALCRFQPR